MSKKSKNNDGRFFEMLVECLQRTLASEGIKVKPDQTFTDIRGNVIGQVDIVLQGRIGSASMKIGVECRDRAEPQGRDWIREVIGKKVDLAKLKFNHWIAVSKYGFTQPAIDLAEEKNIELLVPGELHADNEKDSWFHQIMKLSACTSGYKQRFCQANIETDDFPSKKKEEQIVKLMQTLAPTFLISEDGTNFKTAEEFINQKGGIHYKEKYSSESLEGFSIEEKLEFTRLKGRVDDITFDIPSLTIEYWFYKELVHPEFKLMFFIAPGTTKILGVIGVNEYQSAVHGKIYTMVGFNPNKKTELVLVARDSKGDKFFKDVVFYSPAYPPHIRTMNLKFKVD